MNYKTINFRIYLLLVGIVIISGCNAIIRPLSIYRTWQTPVLLGAANDGNLCDISCNSAGDAVAVWTQSDGITNRIWSRHYTIDESWDGAQIIDSNSGAAFVAKVAVNDSGNAFAIWDQSDGINYRIWANCFISGEGWKTAMIIDSTSENAGLSKVAIDAQGNAIAVWCQSDGTNQRIWANHFEIGNGWNTPQIIDSISEYSTSPQVAVDYFGNAIAVWIQYDGSKNRIWANHYSNAIGWDGAQPIDSDTGNVESPQLAIDRSGKAIVVWVQSENNTERIWAIQYTSSKGWGTSQIIDSNPGLENTSFPHVAINSSGYAIAVWVQYNGTVNRIWANHYSTGKGWERAQLISSNSSKGNASFPRVVVDNYGNALAVWAQTETLPNTVRSRIWANHYFYGRCWDNSRIIDNGIWGEMTRPQVAGDDSGNAIAVWIQSDAVSQFSVWASTYSSYSE